MTHFRIIYWNYWIVTVDASLCTFTLTLNILAIVLVYTVHCWVACEFPPAWGWIKSSLSYIYTAWFLLITSCIINLYLLWYKLLINAREWKVQHLPRKYSGVEVTSRKAENGKPHEKQKYLKIQIHCKLLNNLHNPLIVFSKTDVIETHTPYRCTEFTLVLSLSTGCLWHLHLHCLSMGFCWRRLT